MAPPVWSDMIREQIRNEMPDDVIGLARAKMGRLLKDGRRVKRRCVRRGPKRGRAKVGKCQKWARTGKKRRYRKRRSSKKKEDAYCVAGSYGSPYGAYGGYGGYSPYGASASLAYSRPQPGPYFPRF